MFLLCYSTFQNSKFLIRIYCKWKNSIHFEVLLKKKLVREQISYKINCQMKIKRNLCKTKMNFHLKLSIIKVLFILKNILCEQMWLNIILYMLLYNYQILSDITFLRLSCAKYVNGIDFVWLKLWKLLQ